MWFLLTGACATSAAPVSRGPGWWFPPPLGLMPIRAEPPAIAAFAEPNGGVALLVRLSDDDPVAAWRARFAQEPTIAEEPAADGARRIHIEGIDAGQAPLRLEGALLPAEGAVYVLEAMGAPDAFGRVSGAIDTLLTTAGPALPQGLWGRACQQPCAGSGAIEIWRGPDRRVGRLHIQGDLGRCSHVSSTWWDAEGQELFSATDAPVDAAKASVIRQQLDAIRAGHVRAGTLDCPAPASGG